MQVSEQFRQMMDTVGVLIWCSDPRGNWEYVNKLWHEFTGETRLPVGRKWLARVHPDDLAGCKAALAEHSRSRTAFRIEFRFRRHDGAWRWALCSGVPRIDEAGMFMGFFGSCSDMSSAKAAEAQRLQDGEDKAAMMQELHHRVKNNAQVFASLLSVQASRAADPAVKAALRVAAARAATMAFAQQQIWDAGSSARFDLVGLVRRLIRAQAAREIAVDLAAPDELFVPLSTAVPLGLIVHELLTNALNHAFPLGGAGHVEITLRREAETLSLVVADDGIGMPRLDQSARSAGLTIVSSLVRQLGATLVTEVEPGTAVTISLPCPMP